MTGAGDLLVGRDTGDDAAVLRISGNKAIVQTVDFFTPIVDDPKLFGAISAANSISDIYAMGADPILGLAIAGFPVDKLPLDVLQQILAAGEAKAQEAGFPIGGGHTIIDDVPKYGLAVTGIVDVDKIVRNSTAKPSDLLYLTKPIGNGILISAYRSAAAGGMFRRWISRGRRPSLDAALEWMLMLNRDASRIMREVGVSAATDVTGYGLVGHLLEMCDGSAAGARISLSSVPVLEGAVDLARRFVPAGTERNRDTFRRRVDLQVDEVGYTLLCDAQTSGGLLMAIPPARKSALERAFSEAGLVCAKIGEMTDRVGVVEIIA